MMRWILPLFALLFIACDRPVDRHEGVFHDLPASGWAYGDSVSFPLTADSIPGAERLALAVRHSAAYPYANLWLEVTVPANDSLQVDTINVILADKYGKRLGRGFGVSFLKIDTLPRAYFLADSTSISIRHIMRVDTLTDIEQIGILPL